MDKKLLKNYNLGNLLRALVGGNSPAGLEMEVHQELSRTSGNKPQGVLVPWQALEPMRRDLVVGTPTAGGHLVATEMRAQNFIDLLRPVSIVGLLGATSLNGLHGGVAIPRATSGSSAYWLAENESVTESAASFDQVPMSPKTLGAFTDISRKMMLQSSVDISSFVVADLRASFAQELDRVILGGSGSGSQPTGLLNNTGVPLIDLDTNGRALTWADLVGFYTTVAAANGDEIAPAFVTTKQARGKLMQTEKIATTGKMLWDSDQAPSFPGGGTIGGRRAVATTLLPSDLTKGSGTGLSSMLYGDFSEVIIGTWGSGFDLVIDPYSLGTSGGLRIVAMMDVDVCVRHPNAFVRVKDIVTA